MILTSITPFIELQLKLLSCSIKPPLHLSSKPPRLFGTCHKLSVSTKVRLLIFAGYAVFLVCNGLRQFQVYPRNSNITTIASSSLFSFGLGLSIYLEIPSLFLERNELLRQLNLLLSYEYSNLPMESAGFSEKVQMLQKILKWTVFLFGTGGAVLIPICIALMNLTEHNRPPFIGSVLPETATRRRDHGWVTGVIILAHLAAIACQVWIIFTLCCTIMTMSL